MKTRLLTTPQTPMRVLSLIFTVWLFLASFEVFSKKFKIYRCQQSDGRVVLQDGWCKPGERKLPASVGVPTKPQQLSPKSTVISGKSKRQKQVDKIDSDRPTRSSQNLSAERQLKQRSEKSLKPHLSLPIRGSEQIQSAQSAKGVLSGQTISVSNPKQWIVSQHLIDEKMLHFGFSGGENYDQIEVNIDFVVVPKGKTFSSNELTGLLQKVSQWMSENPQSSDDWIYPLQLQSGVGVYGAFNQSTGAFSYNTKGYMFRHGFLIHFMVMSHDLESENYITAMQSIAEGVTVY